MNGEDEMPLTMSRRPETKSLRVAVIELQAAAIAISGGERTSDVLAPGQPRRTRAIPPPADIVEEWGMQSFPASDPPANW